MFGSKKKIQTPTHQLDQAVEREISAAVETVRPPEILNRLLFEGEWDEYRAACAKAFELLRRRIGVTAPAAHFSLHIERTTSFPRGYLAYCVSPPRRAEDTLSWEGSPRVHPLSRSDAESLRQQSTSRA